MIFFYYAMEWATERYGQTASQPSPKLGMPILMLGHRNHYLNSKPGRAELGEEE